MFAAVFEKTHPAGWYHDVLLPVWKFEPAAEAYETRLSTPYI